MQTAAPLKDTLFPFAHNYCRWGIYEIRISSYPQVDFIQNGGTFFSVTQIQYQLFGLFFYFLSNEHVEYDNGLNLHFYLKKVLFSYRF